MGDQYLSRFHPPHQNLYDHCLPRSDSSDETTLVNQSENARAFDRGVDKDRDVLRVVCRDDSAVPVECDGEFVVVVSYVDSEAEGVCR